MKKEKLDLTQIKYVNFPLDQFVPRETPKYQVCLHHTVSGGDATGDINWWKSTKDRVATHIILERTGQIVQLFDWKYWAWHLGLDVKTFEKNGLPYQLLDDNCIGIEVDSMGGLTQHTNGKWYPTGWDSVNKKRVPLWGYKPIENIITYEKPFRGFTTFERYTDEQIEKLRQLLVFFNEQFDIPLDYFEDIWDVSKRALKGEKGVFTHNSYRYDKSDCHPQPELIKMLKSLK